MLGKYRIKKLSLTNASIDPSIANRRKLFARGSQFLQNGKVLIRVRHDNIIYVIFDGLIVDGSTVFSNLGDDSLHFAIFLLERVKQEVFVFEDG